MKGKIEKGEILRVGVWLKGKEVRDVDRGEEGVGGWVKKLGEVNVEYMENVWEMGREEVVEEVEEVGEGGE